MRLIIRCAALYLAISSSAQAIVMGTDDISNTYSSVGYTLTSGGALGSVVALTPNWILTAAHVVEDAPALVVMGDAFAGTEGAYIFFDQVILHHDYVSGEFHDDLALVRISDIDPINPVPGYIDASFATLSNVDPGSSVLPSTATITGYGTTDIDAGIDPNAPLVRRYGIAETDPFGPADPGFDPGFPYDCSLDMFICTWSSTGGGPGDSGGALFLDYGNGDIVAGINSFIFDENDLFDPAVTPNWDDGYWTVATSTAYYQDWILENVPDANFAGITAVPVPAALWLFSSGFIVLAGLGYKRAESRD